MSFRPSKKLEFALYGVLFALLWSYIWIRSLQVPLIHDEIQSMWLYMIDFNPFPYTGYIDANNHFLNSLIGGVMVRLTGLTDPWVIRFGSVMAFPIYFWSIIGFRPFFEKKFAYVSFLLLFTNTPFLLDYFNLARGYGLSMAFLVLALLQTALFLKKQKCYFAIFAAVAWLLSVFASLTLLPFALAGLTFLLVLLCIQKKWFASLLVILSYMPVFYLVKYSFYLKDLGKLYYGGQEGFIENTVTSLVSYIWMDSPWVYLVLQFLFVFVIIASFVQIGTYRSVLQPQMLYFLFFLLAIVNIFAQHFLFKTNFPEDRAALYLPLFFFGTLAFLLDFYHFRFFSWLISGICVFFFVTQINFSHSLFFAYEHFNPNLLLSMDEEIGGIPPTTGGRFWSMDNELTRTNSSIKAKVLQEVSFPADTLLDYIVTSEHLIPDEYKKLYHPIYTDEVSEITLFQRKSFLERSFLKSSPIAFDSQTEFVPIMELNSVESHAVHLKGQISGLNLHYPLVLVFTVDSKESNENLYYGGYDLIQSCPISNGAIELDLSLSLNSMNTQSIQKVYIWNKKKLPIKGALKVSIYQLED